MSFYLMAISYYIYRQCLDSMTKVSLRVITYLDMCVSNPVHQAMEKKDVKPYTHLLKGLSVSPVTGS